MSLKSGSATYQVFDADSFPESAEPFMDHAFPGLINIGKEPVSGFATGEGIFNGKIDDDNMRVAGFPILSLVQAERKIPSKYLAAECALEEKARMLADNKLLLKRQERMEIKKEVIDRLIKDAMPTLSEIQFVNVDDGGENKLYAETGSESKLDALSVALRSHAKINLRLLDPEYLAYDVDGYDAGNIPQMNLTNGPAQDLFTVMPGCEFLTFLLYSSDKGSNSVSLNKKSVAFVVEPPYSFVSCGDDAGSMIRIDPRGEEYSVRKCPEVRASLESSKLLSSCKLTLAMDDYIWSATVDGIRFLFSGATVSKGDGVGEVERFEERMIRLTAMTDAFFGIYRKFIVLRLSSKWTAIEHGMRQWLEGWMV